MTAEKPTKRPRSGEEEGGKKAKKAKKDRKNTASSVPAAAPVTDPSSHEEVPSDRVQSLVVEDHDFDYAPLQKENPVDASTATVPPDSSTGPPQSKKLPKLWPSFQDPDFAAKTPFFLQRFLTRNFATPSPVQAATWPLFVGTSKHRDLVVIAPTGTGKTLSYLIPAFARVLSAKRPKNKHTTPLAAVLLPTRELCCQQKRFCDQFYPSVRSCGIFGGNSKYKQVSALNAGCDVVLATPGRLNDILAEQKTGVRKVSAKISAAAPPSDKEGVAPVSGETSEKNPKDKTSTADEWLQLNHPLFGQLEFLVVDEGDRMLDSGFEPQLRKIVDTAVAQRRSSSSSEQLLSEAKHTTSEVDKEATKEDVGKKGSTFSTLFVSASWPASVAKLAADLFAQKAGALGTKTNRVPMMLQVRSAVFPQEKRSSSAETFASNTSGEGSRSPTSASSTGDLPSNTTNGLEFAAANGGVRQEFRAFSMDKKGFTDGDLKVEALINILNAHRTERVLVFCNMKKTCTWLHQKLLERLTLPGDANTVDAETVEFRSSLVLEWPPAGREQQTATGPPREETTAGATVVKFPRRSYLRCIHSDMQQEKRCETFLQFRTRKCRILVGTDVASRGLDVVGLNLVVNFDCAERGEDHLHRIGRVGRGATLVGSKKQHRAITFIGDRAVKQARHLVDWTPAAKNDEVLKKVLAGSGASVAIKKTRTQRRVEARKDPQEQGGGAEVDESEALRCWEDTKEADLAEEVESGVPKTQSASAKRRERRKKAVIKK